MSSATICFLFSTSSVRKQAHRVTNNPIGPTHLLGNVLNWVTRSWRFLKPPWTVLGLIAISWRVLLSQNHLCHNYLVCFLARPPIYNLSANRLFFCFYSAFLVVKRFAQFTPLCLLPHHHSLPLIPMPITTTSFFPGCSHSCSWGSSWLCVILWLCQVPLYLFIQLQLALWFVEFAGKPPALIFSWYFQPISFSFVWKTSSPFYWNFSNIKYLLIL